MVGYRLSACFDFSFQCLDHLRINVSAAVVLLSAAVAAAAASSADVVGAGVGAAGCGKAAAERHFWLLLRIAAARVDSGRAAVQSRFWMLLRTAAARFVSEKRAVVNVLWRLGSAAECVDSVGRIFRQMHRGGDSKKWVTTG